MSLASIAKYATVVLAGGMAMIGTNVLTSHLIRRSKASSKKQPVLPTDGPRTIPLRALAVAKQIVSRRDWDGLMRTPSAEELLENCSDELFEELMAVEESIAIDHIAPQERVREFEDRTELVIHDIIKQHVEVDMRKQHEIVQSRIGSVESRPQKRNRSIMATV